MRDEKDIPTPSPHPVVYGEGSVNTIIDTSGPTMEISSQSSKDEPWPLLNDIPLSQGLDMDRYIAISDDFMNEQGCQVYHDRQSNDIQIRFRGELKAVFNERGHFDPKSGLHLEADYWRFDQLENMDLWTACIIAEDVIAKANRLQDGVNKQKSIRQVIQANDNTPKVNRSVISVIPVTRKRGDETTAITQNLLSFQEQFQQEWKQQAKFESVEEANIVQDVATTLSDVAFPVQSAEATLSEERGGLARKALESVCAVIQGQASLIHDIARNRTQNLVSQLCKIWEASVLTVGDTQRERESRLKGIQVAADEQDVLSKTSRQKFKRKMSAKSIVEQQNKFLELANVRIEITSTVTNSQNDNEQSGFEGYNHGSIALNDQSRASGNLLSQCQEGQSYDMGAGQQQGQPCRLAFQLTLELTDESQINSQSGKVNNFILIQADQQQKHGSNQQTDLRVGKRTVEQSNAIRLKETYMQICRQAYINTSWSLRRNLESSSEKNRQNQTTELHSRSIKYQQHAAYSSIRSYSNREQADALYPSLVMDWSRSINLKRDQGLLDTSRVPRDIEKEQIEVHSNKARRQFENVGLINRLRCIRADGGKSNIRRSSLGESLFCNTQKQPWEMEKDNRLFDSEQISKNKPYQNGGYQYIKRDLVTQRLYDKDRSIICLPSYPSGSRVQTVPGVLTQESVLSILSNVLWGETRTTNIPQGVETSYEINQREAGKRNWRLKSKIFCRLFVNWLDDLGRQVLPLTNLRNRIPRIADQLKTQSDNDVELQKKEDAKSDWKMEKNNSAKDFSQSEVSRMFHRSIEFPQTINQERGPPHEKAEQDKAKSSDYQRMKQQGVSAQDHIVRSILVEEQDRVEQTDQSHSVATTSHPNNGLTGIIIGDQLAATREKQRPFIESYSVQEAAAISLLKLTDRILEVAEDSELQIRAFHIYGKENTISDSISRLVTSGDYSFKEEILQNVLIMLKIRPSIDMFSNRRNRKFVKFVSLSQDKWAVAQDCLSISWQLEVPYLHPPIPLIQQTLNKLM
ncbi:MAG: hypothetical protein EZS28_014094, partial [Streblomastix strix]